MQGRDTLITKAERILNSIAVFVEHPARYFIKYNDSCFEVMQNGLRVSYPGEKAGNRAERTFLVCYCIFVLVRVPQRTRVG
jgi:hypothetical protein